MNKKPYLLKHSTLSKAAALMLFSTTAYAASQTYQDANGLNTWNTTDANWDSGVTWGSGNDATFGGTGESVAVGTVTARNITFNSPGYTLTGGTLTLTGTTPTITTATGVTATISSIVASSNGLTKSGAGTLTLNSAAVNTYTGLTTVSDGTLNVVLPTATANSSSVYTGGFNVAAGKNLGLDLSDVGLQYNIQFGPIALNSGSTLTLTNTKTADDGFLFRSTTFSGSGGIINKQGGGYICLNWSGGLSNWSGFSGTLNINGGTVGSNVGNGVTSNMSKVAVNVASGAALDVRTGTLMIDSFNGDTGSLVKSTNAGGNALSVGNNNGSGTFAGTIQNQIGFIKNGSGTQTLTGANTYTGVTTINGGMLDLGGGTATGSISASSALILGGGTLSYTRTGSTTQTFNGTTINAGSSAVTAVAGNTVNLGGIIRTAIGGTVDFGTTGSVITSTGNTNGILGGYATFGGSTWAVGNGAGAITGFAGYTTTTAAGTVVLNYLNNNIDVDSSVAPVAAITPNSLRFNTAAANTLTLTGTNTISSGGILVTNTVGNNLSTITGGTLVGASGKDLVVIQNNTANSLTIGSIITNNGGATGLTKSGAGTLILTNAGNNYTGGTNVNAGTLKLDFTARTGSISIGTVTVGSNGTLELFSSASTINRESLYFNGAAAAAVSGSGIINKTGPGALQFHAGSQINAFTGRINVQGGLLATNGSDWSSTATMALDLSGSTFLDIRTGSIGVSALTGLGSIGVSHTAGANLTVGNNNASSQFDGTIRDVISGYAGTGYGSGSALNLFKTGSGTLTLTGANDYTGTTNISGGTLQIGNNGTTGTLGSGAVTNNGALVFNRTNAITVANAISGAGTVTQAGGSTLTLTNSANTYTGNTTISAGTLEIGGAGRLNNGAYAGNISNDGTLLVSTSANQTLSGITSGTGALTKSGAGALTLSGQNTYTGATTLNSGTLNVTGSLTSATTVNGGVLTGIGTLGSVTVANGTAAITAGNGTSGALTLGSLTFNGTGIVNIGTLTNYTATAAVNVTGALTLNGAAGGVTLNLNTAPVVSGSYLLLGFGSTNLIDVSKFALGTGPALTSRQSGTLTLNAGNLAYVVAGDAPKWTGAESNAWTTDIIGGSSNWKLITGGGATDYLHGDIVLFDDSATRTTVDISTEHVGPASVTFANSTEAYTIGSTGGLGITGAGSLTVSGGGTVTINTANSYSGGTTISGGSTVITGSGTALGTAAVALGSGTLNVNGQALGNDITLGGGAIVGSGTLSGVLSGSLGFTYNSVGDTLTLAGVNTYTGATTITAGTLEIGGSGKLGGASGIYAGNISNAGTLLVSTSAAQTFSGSISGAGALTKSGSGTLTLSGANTSYTGAVSISGGTLQLGNINALTGNNDVTLAAGSSNATLYFQANGNHVIKTLTVGAGATGATIQTAAWAPAVNGVTTLNSVLTQKGVNTGVWNGVQFNGKITGNGAGAGNDSLILDANGQTAISNAFVWQYNGTAANDFVGNVRVKGGTTNAQAIGNNADLNVIIPDAALLTIDAGSTLRWNNTDNGGGPRNIIETIDGLAGGGTFDRAGAGNGSVLTINANNTANNANRSFSGSLANWSGVTFNGTGTQEFVGTNLNYTNATNLNNGTLKLTDTTAWNSAITFGGSGTPKLQLNRTTGSWNLANNITGGSTGSVLEKTGAGAVTLSGTNTYLGTTLVTGGTLVAGNNGAFGSSTVSVNSGGTLDINAKALANAFTINGGTLAGAAGSTLDGTVTIGASGVVIASGATITLNGNITLNTGVITTDDTGLIANSGTLTLGGLGILDLGGNFDSYSGPTYTLISTAVTGNFASVTGFNTSVWSAVTFDDASGNLVFTAVPEPSTYGLIGAGALAAVALVRRRRRLAGKVAE